MNEPAVKFDHEYGPVWMQDLANVMPRDLTLDLEQNACGSIYVNAQ